MMKLENKEFAVAPDVRTYKMLRDEMRAVCQELFRLRDCSEMNERLTAKVELLAELFVGIAGERFGEPPNRRTILLMRWKGDSFSYELEAVPTNLIRRLISLSHRISPDGWFRFL